MLSRVETDADHNMYIPFWDNPILGLLKEPNRHSAVLMKSIHTERYSTLLRALIACRKEKGLSQTELAQRVGRPQSYISKVENAERRLDVIEFLEICEAIGVEGGEVMRGV
jgi:ribosome-binding protein aMBF1 (putative translation factor)